METIDMGALRAEQSRLIDARKAIAEQAVTIKSLPAEQQSVALDQLEATNANLKAELDAVNAQIKSVNRKLMFGSGAIDQQAEQPQRKSTRGGLLGSPLQLNEAGWKSLLAGAGTGRGMIDLSSDLHRKQFTDTVTTKSDTWDGTSTGSGLTSGAILPQLFPMLPQALEQTRVADLFPHIALSSPAFSYPRHLGTTTEPGVTAEGATKPAIAMNIDVVEGRVEKLAGTYTHSWELARDYEQFVNVALPSELTRVLIDAESKFLLGTAQPDEEIGTTPPSTGLLGAAGLTYAVPSGDTAAGSAGLRAINKSITMLRTGSALAQADSIVLSPNTFGELRGAVDSMGRFILADANGEAAIPRIWNLDVVVTTMIADGTCLIFDSQKFAQVMVRDGIQMFATNQGAELASSNQIMHVIEERVGLSVPWPTAGLVLTGVVG